MMKKWISAACLATLLVSAAAYAQAPAARRDTVRKMDGKILANVTIIAETPDEVKIDTTGNGQPDTTLDQNDVKQIQYGDVPLAYRQGEAFLGVSQFDKAIQAFQKAMADPNARAWVRQYSEFRIAQALARRAEGDPTQRPQAIDAFRKVASDDQNPWRDQARYRLSMLYLGANDAAKARQVLTQLEQSGHREEMKLTASMGLAQLLTAEKKPQDALDRYTKVVDAARDKYPALYADATVGRAAALIALQKFAEAQNFLDGVIKTANRAQLLARAYSLQGDCYRAQAEASAKAGDDEKAQTFYRAALMSYLRNVVVYFDQKAEYARSLLYAGTCWKKLGDDQKAAGLFAELRGKFPGSTYAKDIPR